MALPIRRGGGALRHRPAWGAWDPVGDFENIWSEMGKLLEQATPTVGAASWMPIAEEEEEEDAYVVRAELPGVPPEHVNIELEGNELSVSGELKEEQRGKVLSRRTGKFSYRTSLPGTADSDNIDADLTNGILTVRIPKTEEGKRRKIEIGSHRQIKGETA
jgi:HSP20 family protein